MLYTHLIFSLSVIQNKQSEIQSLSEWKKKSNDRRSVRLEWDKINWKRRKKKIQWAQHLFDLICERNKYKRDTSAARTHTPCTVHCLHIIFLLLYFILFRDLFAFYISVYLSFSRCASLSVLRVLSV